MPSPLETGLQKIEAKYYPRLYIPNQDEIPNLLSSRFSIEEILGEGGQGIVYQATEFFQTSGETIRQVAIKALKKPDENLSQHQTKQIYANFQREAIVQAHFFDNRFPQVYELIDIDTPKGKAFFISMQYLSPEEYFNLDSPLVHSLPLDEKINIITNLTSFLGKIYKHTKQHPEDTPLLHNDLAADAILYNPEEKAIKVIDWGMNSYTQNDIPMGKIHFIPPEAYRAVDLIDVRTEIWRLGCITYYLTTGHRYLGETQTQDSYKLNMPKSGHGLRDLELNRIRAAANNNQHVEDFFCKTFSLHPPDRQSSFEQYGEEILTAFGF